MKWRHWLPDRMQMTADQLSRTYGLYMDADKLRAPGFGFMHAHVAGDALCARSVVDGDEPLPLLHCAWHLSWDAQALLLDLSIEAVQVQVNDRAVIGVQALSSPAALHVTCMSISWSGRILLHKKMTCESTCPSDKDAGRHGNCGLKAKHDAPKYHRLRIGQTAVQAVSAYYTDQ